ncbi:MAG: hypothetical protein LBC67_04175 [Spirochaetales bacterium]|nr:hypothetical protein [Spirochaetales bacterium]
MDFFVFRNMKINKDTFLENKKDFLSFSRFCLNTAQRTKEENITKGLQYFEKNYAEIKKRIDKKDIDTLKDFVYNTKGVGQKIGSMMLEFIYLYSNKKDEKIAGELYVPLDTHITRLFKECFHVENVPGASQLNIADKKFQDFQASLRKYTNGKPVVYFDYLWFIGKVFCNKVNPHGEKNRGYKLCNLCWLKTSCGSHDKWL